MIGEPIISLRNPEGSEVLPVGTSAGPFSVIFVFRGLVEWWGMMDGLTLEVRLKVGREERLGVSDTCMNTAGGVNI